MDKKFTFLLVLVVHCLFMVYVDGAESERTSHFGRTLVFSRAQLKYGLGKNYMRRWDDRPLMHDRLTRINGKKDVMTYSSFERMVKIVKSYGLDGFAFFPSSSGRSIAFDYADKINEPDFNLLPDFFIKKGLQKKLEVVKLALNHKSSLRIDGKTVFSSYCADSFKPSEWKELLGEVHKEYGDKIVVLCSIIRPAGKSWVTWRMLFKKQGGVQESDREKIKKYLRQYLDVSDGLHFNGQIHGLRTKDRKFDLVFYRDFIIKIYQEVLAEPKYKNKYLGLSASNGYFWVMSGSTLSEDGTKTFRHSFEAAMNAHPDIVELPEWDEENENDFIRPTVFNSFSSRRILRYYMQQIKKEALSPYPGDNMSIPNFVVSYRKLMTLGEKLDVEVLNIPDQKEKQINYNIKLILKDINGNILKSFPWKKLSSAKLEDVTFTVATENFAGQHVLIPCLQVESNDHKKQIFEEGLHYINLRSTWNWDYKWVKQPLRDLCILEKATFSFQEKTDFQNEEQKVQGAVTCDENLAFVEVLENDDVVYAVDPYNEYFRDDEDKVLLCVEVRALRRQKVVGSITFAKMKCFWPVIHYAKEQKSPKLSDDTNKNTFDINLKADNWVRCVFVAVAKKDVAQGNITLNCNLCQMKIPAEKVIAESIYSQTYKDGLTITISKFNKMPDVPYNINKPVVHFSAIVTPEMKSSVFHMRAITKSGKIYRSKPIMLPMKKIEKMGETTISVYSDTENKAVRFNVPVMQVPDITYEFNQDHGDILYTAAGRPFWGILGGYMDTATGRSGGESGAGTIFIRRPYPMDAHQTNPAWVMEDGKQCLKFDGKGNYIILPVEAFPRTAGFTLTFDIKPTCSKNQVLFFTGGQYSGALMVYLDDDELKGSYFAINHLQDDGLYWSVSHNLNPHLFVKCNQWSRVTISYDQSAFTFKVNDKTSASILCPGPGYNLGMTTFGGFENKGKPTAGHGTRWFEGYLQSLRIRHSVK